MKQIFTPENILGRRWSSSEFLATVAGILVFSDPLAISLVAGGYLLARSFRKMYRPAFGSSGFVTSEFLALVGTLAKLVVIHAPEAHMAAVVGVFCLGRGLVKRLSPAPKSGQHIHL